MHWSTPSSSFSYRSCGCSSRERPHLGPHLRPEFEWMVGSIVDIVETTSSSSAGRRQPLQFMRGQRVRCPVLDTPARPWQSRLDNRLSLEDRLLHCLVANCFSFSCACFHPRFVRFLEKWLHSEAASTTTITACSHCHRLCCSKCATPKQSSFEALDDPSVSPSILFLQANFVEGEKYATVENAQAFFALGESGGFRAALPLDRLPFPSPATASC